MDDAERQYNQLIIESLQAVLSADKSFIEKGQQQLAVLETRSDYSLMLVKILLDVNYDISIRQLAGVLFKQYVEIHWSQNSEEFKSPEIEYLFKIKIKNLLPIGLADNLSKIRTTVAYAIATIAYWDWPELWPDLFDILIQSLSTNDVNAIDGSIKTLKEFIGDVSDTQMEHVAPRIMPQIYNIFVNPQHFKIRIKSRTIEIFNSLVTIIAGMSEYDKFAVKKYLNPYLEDFINAMIKSLSIPDDNKTMDCGLRKEIISALTNLVKSFPKKLSIYMNSILAQIWNSLVQYSSIYVSIIVNCSSDNMNPNGNVEEELNYDNFVHQLFEFILCLKETNRYKPIVKKTMEELCYYTIIYMQITEEQIETWMSNPERFVEEEDEDSFSSTIRVSGQELLDNIASEFKNDSANAICKALSRHIEYGQNLKESQNPYWWKIYESSLLAINSFKEVILDLSKNNSLQFDLNAFINQVVLSSLHESNYPFLVGRALFTASKFSKIISIETLKKLVEASASVLQSNQNIIIKISSVKAVYNFCSELTNDVKQQILVPHLTEIIIGLVNIITENTTNQIGVLSLETFTVVLSIDEKFVSSLENKISPLMIALFIKYSNDPIMNSIVTDILKLLITNSYTYEKLGQRLLPTISSILAATNTDNNYSTLLTASLDLLTTFVRSAPNIPLSDYLINLFIIVANLCLTTDDTAILQGGGECLRAYISKSSDQIINCKNENGISALSYIVMVISHMLDPKTSENSCSFIGKFINTVIRHTAHALGDNLELILKAVLSKMRSSEVLLVQQSLIIVFAHLIHTQMDNVLTFLTNIPGPTGKPVLEFLMVEWVSKQNSFIGPYECKISILALAKLLEHAVSKDDTRFQNIFVKGDRIINPTEGIKTRSKSKTEKELYTQIPLLVKIYKLLINELSNQIESKKDDNDDQYDDYDEDDEDDDDENADDHNDNSNIETNIDVDQDNENLNKYLNRCDLLDDIFEKDQIFDEDDPDAFTDPLNDIDLLEYLSQYLRTLSQHPCYAIFKEHHNEIEKEVLKEIGIMN